MREDPTLPRFASTLFGALVALFAVATAAHVVADRPVVGVDPAFYQHVGWYVTRGAVPYVDVWDLNPPLTFAVTALLAVLAGGDPALLHALAALVTFLAAGGAVCLTAWLAFDLTGDDGAALAAGLVLLAVPVTWGVAPWGVRSQVFAFAAGVLALALARVDRPFVAGGSAAAAAGFWLPGGAVALLVVGMAATRGGRRGGLRVVVGGLSVALAVALPFLVADAFVPMVTQTVVAPIVAQEPYSLLGRVYALVLATGYATLLLPVALLGWVRSAGALGERWWVPAGAGLYGLQVALINLNGSLDALLFLVFVALGVAIAVEAVPTDRRRWVLAALAILVVTGPVWHLVPAAPIKGVVDARHHHATPDSRPELVEVERYPPDVRAVYWERRRPETCHYRLSHTELRWVAETEAVLAEERCGPG